MDATKMKFEAMSDDELRSGIKERDEVINVAWKNASERPRLKGEYLVIPGGVQRLKEFQAKWDSAHPVEAAALSAVDPLIEEREAMEAEVERRQRARAKHERVMAVLADCPRIRAALEKGLDDSPAYDVVRDWYASKSWCLLLLGGVGCGKSTAAGWFVVTAAKKGAVSMWVRAVEASRMSAFGAEAEARFRAWREADCLVLDDLGTELMTPTWQQALDDILDYRYQHSLETMLPTNLSADEFKTRYGERISDRIRHEGTIHSLAAPSMRTRSPRKDAP